jgi:hypothetical protein
LLSSVANSTHTDYSPKSKSRQLGFCNYLKKDTSDQSTAMAESRAQFPKLEMMLVVGAKVYCFHPLLRCTEKWEHTLSELLLLYM